MSADRWNHNIHHHPLVLDAIPAHAQRALDVGCGDGVLTRDLAERVPQVVGIDLDAPILEVARTQTTAPGITYVRGDVLHHPFELGSFDVVASIAALHHMDATVGLERMRDLLRPGGALVVIGLARSRLPRDLPWELAGAVATRIHKLTKTYSEVTAPTVWPPPETYDGMRRIAEQTLPGARHRRHVLWRYSLVWTKPAP